MTWETVSCCDDCWWGSEATFIPNGRGVVEEGIRQPMRFTQEMRNLEACHFCGWPSYSGIYIRVDTDEQPAAGMRVRKEEL